MKKLLTILIFLLIASSASAKTYYTVELVIDGRTVQFTDGKIVRLIGVDAEKVGYEATEHLRAWVEGKDVHLVFDEATRDEDGRMLAYMFKRIEVKIDLKKVGKDLNRVVIPIEDEDYYEVFVNAAMIGNGYARARKNASNEKYAVLFQELYEEAKELKRGFWKDGHLRSIAQCAKAGGMLKNIKECDGSDSDWCIISETEQCYGHQVSNGKCVAGEYSEDRDAITGITPRVVCDSLDESPAAEK